MCRPGIACVALQCHDAVALLLDDRLGNGTLAVECIDGDGAAGAGRVADRVLNECLIQGSVVGDDTKRHRDARSCRDGKNDTENGEAPERPVEG